MEKLANIHLGEILNKEFLEPLELTAYRLSKDLKIPQEYLKLLKEIVELQQLLR
jgi:plasmid maintenance system antidote protein VapI